MARATVDGYRSIDIQEGHRQGLLKPGESISWSWERNGRKVASIGVEVESHRIVLWYGIRGPRRKYTLFKEPVYLEFSPCNYGGKRPWFLCPRCCRRVVALDYCGHFSCRCCQGLVYQSQQVCRWKRAVRRMQKIRMRLGGCPDLGIPFPPKPPQMRWSTYERLVLEEQKAAEEHLTALKGGIERAEDSAEKLAARRRGS
jgi:hypothetical protein